MELRAGEGFDRRPKEGSNEIEEEGDGCNGCSKHANKGFVLCCCCSYKRYFFYVFVYRVLSTRFAFLAIEKSYHRSSHLCLLLNQQ